VLETSPLLVIEVVSPESIKRDYRYKRCSAVLGVSPMSDCIKKRSEYAAIDINEYWIVDPIKQQVTILVLDEGLYEETIFTSDQELLSPSFTEIKLTPKQIFTAENI
jgi:Uma2 family endonuclease